MREKERFNGGERTTLGSNHTSWCQCLEEEIEIWLLEECFGGTFRVRAVGYDDVEFVLVVLEVLKPVADDDLDIRVLEANGHVRKEFLGDTGDGLVKVSIGSVSACLDCQ